MSRMPRICLVVVLLFVLVAAVPAAHARTLAKPQSSNSIIGNWFDATLSWVVNFVTGAPHGQQAHGAKTITGSLGSGSGGVGVARPMTGSCIDPNGNPIESPRCGGV